jgi:hypothetical protein
LKIEEDGAWITKRYPDINLEIETESGNDGKMVKIIIEDDDREIDLSGIVSESKVLFEKVFK